MQPLLSLQKLSKGYVGVQALSNVNLDVLPGEVHALVGENGAGKSTLLKILSGAIHPDEGRILFDGEPIDGLTPRTARDKGISLIHQELALVPQLTAVGNVFLGRELRTRHRSLDRTRMRRQTHDILDRLGFEVDLKCPVSRLSIAQRQGVEITRALLYKARVLALDEPTSSITNQERDRLFAAIKQLRAEGVGIIYVSHRMEELFEIADRATVLRDGQLVGCVQMAATSTAQLVRMMVGRDLPDRSAEPGRPRGPEALRVESLSAGPVRNISFTAYHGQVLGIAGLVGSGRTELLRAVFGADRVESGSVVVDGEPLRRGGPARSISLGLALIPEDRKDHGLVLGMPVTANITMARSKAFSKAGFILKGKRRAMVGQLISDLQIRPAQPERPVRYLSGGNQQKTIVARWLCAGSRVLLFDEPTRGVDVGAKADIYRLIDAHVRQGGAAVVVSSDLPEILQISDRILVMRQGEMAAELEREAASEELIMHHATGGAS